MPSLRESQLEVVIPGVTRCVLAVGSDAKVGAHRDGHVVWRPSPGYETIADVTRKWAEPDAPGGLAFVNWRSDRDLADTDDWVTKLTGRNRAPDWRTAVQGAWGEYSCVSFDASYFPHYVLLIAVRVDPTTALMVEYSIPWEPDPGWDPETGSPSALFSLVPGFANR